jgi:triosephosphate isomerase
MTDALRPLVAGNWKMNGLRAALGEIQTIAAACASTEAGPEIVICPPATLLSAASDICRGGHIRLGGQDCHCEASGAHTGDLSAEMLADAGAAYVILGHSERRADHGETNDIVRTKARTAFRANLAPIICVGESKAQREAGEALSVVGDQLKGSVPVDPGARVLVVAYEPVWAIGTGLVPTAANITEMHDFIRAELRRSLPGRGETIQILYGGSVKPDNVSEISKLSNVNGVLVGGASLKAEDFLKIIGVYR